MAPAILHTMFTIPENIHWWLSICWTAQQFQRQCFCSASSAIIIIMHTQALFHYNLTRLLSGSAKIRSTESTRAGWLRKPKLPTKTALLFFPFFFYFFSFLPLFPVSLQLLVTSLSFSGFCFRAGQSFLFIFDTIRILDPIAIFYTKSPVTKQATQSIVSWLYGTALYSIPIIILQSRRY